MAKTLPDGEVVELISSSLASSSSLSFRRIPLLKLATRWNGNGGTKSKSVSRRTREQATKVKPEENSFLPTLMTTLSSVRPWDL